MSTPTASASKLVVDKTRDLTVRCGLLSNNIEALLQEQADYIRRR
jgi:hypothetical protein